MPQIIQNMKVMIIGNSASGKSTMAAKLASSCTEKTAVLSLDQIAWDPGPVRKPIEESRNLLLEFIRSNESWVIEGCYADLMEFALPFCSELRFLNPGIDVCIQQARGRAWEPEKFSSPEEQNAMLEYLLDWIAIYETRTDEFGLARHRALYDGFSGEKHEFALETI